jgi:integrase
MTLVTFPVPDVAGHEGEARLVTDWVVWLRERLDPQWRCGEWDESLLLFRGDPGNPRTSVTVCPLPGCGVTTNDPHSSGYCKTCHDEFVESGLAKEEFEATYTRSNRRLNVYRQDKICEVLACRRDSVGLGLCVIHYRSWVKVRNRPGIDRTVWMAVLGPATKPESCGVLACQRERTSVRTGLCRTHHNKWRTWSSGEGVAGDDVALTRWIEHQPPYLSAHMFSLAPLQAVLRLEVLYALQQRDARGADLYPQTVRRTIAMLGDLPCIALAGEAFPDPARATMNDLVRGHLRMVHWEITTAFDQFRGVDPTRKLVWDLRTVSQQIPSLKKGVSPLRNPSMLDFGQLRQEWIREILMHWARTTKPISKDLRLVHKACLIASRALDLRPDGGADPAKLRFSDVTVVVDAFKLAHNDKGQLYATSHQAVLLGHFFDLLDFGRREGAAGDLSPRFVRHPGHHTIKRVDENEDEIGKAIPDVVIRQLDQHVHLLGKGFPYGDLSPEVVAEMFRTAYVVLRDTGRRPAEVAGLDLDCLEFEQGDYQLVWHNMKGRRLRRRLPIHQQTADAINGWKQTRARLELPRDSADHLFPAISSNYRHMDSGYISRVIRLWVDSIPVLDSEELGSDGTPLPFERSKIFPYAFRHTFCQRYADAGVLQHVLQALMDHKSADTTAAYFQVSKKMKREAVNTLRVLALDRQGNPAPMSSAAAYEMRAVAAPWGNCVEPANVKAGGNACPIRWQCPGCSHYRPDPSHLPAIEDQVRSLRANLELARAMDAAHYTIAGMEGEIADYLKVIATMKDKMAAMSEEERRDVEAASKVLRRLRAGGVSSAPVALPMPIVRPAEEAAS